LRGNGRKHANRSTSRTLKACDNLSRQGDEAVQNDVISRVKNLVGEKGLLPVRDSTGFRGEAGFTVSAVEPPTEAEDDIDSTINKSRFTVRFDQGTLIDGNDTGAFRGSAFSKLTGVHILGASACHGN
jgi:hypothetical protein